MKKNESGRSMVEMLGVLAIIGVLSIGGIAGYTIAMNRYRANEWLNTAAQVSILAMTKDGGKGNTATLQDLGGVGAVTLSGANTNDDVTAYANGVVVLTNTESDVTKVIRELSGKRTNETSCNGTTCTLNMKSGV